MIKFLVQGSEPVPYEVVFDRKGDRLCATCSCKAGMMGMFCKHRLRILAGDAEGMVSGNTEDLKTLQGWITGSEVERAVHDAVEGEEEVERAKRKVAAAKKTLAKAMYQ